MNYFSMLSPLSSLGLLLYVIIIFNRPITKRKIFVYCICSGLLSTFLAYPAYMERHELPSYILRLDGAMAVLFLLAPIWMYRQACLMLQTAEKVKLRSAKRAAYIKSLWPEEDKESS